MPAFQTFLSLQIGEEPGGLLEDARNGTIAIQMIIMFEAWPEEVGVSGPHRSEYGLFLEIEVVGIVLRQGGHHTFLHPSFHRVQLVCIVHHVGDGPRLLVRGQQLLVVHQLLHVVSPRAIVDGLPEEIEELSGGLLLVAEDGTAGHVSQQLHIPAVFHAVLHADTVTLVHHAVLVEHQTACHMIHIDG